MKSRGPFHRAARAVARRALRKAAQKLAPVGELKPETWRLERDPQGRLTLDGVVIAELTERIGSPVHVVDAVRLRENAARFTHCPSAHGQTQIFYSYKTNPVPGVLAALHAAGVGAECSSAFELWLARTLGVPAARTLFNCPVKPDEALRDAIDREVELIVVNTRYELPEIARIAKALGKRPRIAIRVAVPQTETSNFGERIDDGTALQAFNEAMQRPELDVVGVHAHFNGAIETASELQAFVGAILDFCSTLRARLRLDLKVIDLGGNLVCPTVKQLSPVAARVQMALGREAPPRAAGEGVLAIDEYIATATSMIEAHCKREGVAMPRVFLEPGRSMTSNAQLLLLKVVQVRKPDETGIATVMLDGGINVADPLRIERHQIFAATVRPGADVRHYRLIGPTSTAADIVAPSVMLPRLEPGDVLAVMDSGAYFIPFSTTFSYPRPGVVMLDRGTTTLLRRAETFEDLVALDRLEAA